MDRFAYDHGKIAYSAYSKATNGLTHDGQPMPDWDGLSSNTKMAWAVAATAAGDATMTIMARRLGWELEAQFTRVADTLKQAMAAKYPVPSDEKDQHDLEDEAHIKECLHPECVKARNQ